MTTARTGVGAGPFVGRGTELAELTACLAAAAEGAGGLVLVSGPAGIGKTRVVEEATAAAPAIVWGRCVDDPGAPPLWPWRRILHARPDAGAAVAEALAEVDLLREHSADPEAARFRFVAAATEAVLGSAGDGGSVIVLEDLHWADEASLRLLRHLAGELSRSRVLVVGTYRDPAGAAGERLDRTLPELLRWPWARALPLRPLTEDDVRTYLGAPARSTDVVRAAHRRSGGNPLYLRAVARGLRSPPEGTGDGRSELRHLVRTTLSSLAPATLDLLDAAAVLGEELDAPLLAAVTDRPPAELMAGLDDAVRAGVLTALPDAPGRRRFAHAVVRDAIYDELTPSTREELHRRAAEALARAMPEDDATAGPVAGHWLRAAGPEAPRHAASWARRAAGTATRTLAFDEAARFLGIAMDAARRSGAGDDELAALLVDLAIAEFRTGRFTQALEHAVAASDLASGCGRGDLLAAAALAVHDVGAPELQPGLLRLCERALDAVDADDLALRSRLLSQTAAALADSARPGAALPPAAEALALAERCGDPGAVVDAVRARMKASPTAVEPAEQLRLGLLAIEQAETTAQPLAALWGAKWRIDGSLELGDLATADDELARVTALADRTRLPLVRWHDRRLRASVAALRGRFAEAFALNDEAREIGARELADDLSTMGLSAAFHLQHALVTGEAPRWTVAATATLERAGDAPIVLVTRALIALLEGRRDEAGARYEDLRGRTAEPEFVTASGVDLNLVPLVEVFGDVVNADVLSAQMSRRLYRATGAGIYAQGSTTVLLGRLSLVRGRRDEATDWFERALAEDTATGARPAVVNDRISLSRALLDRAGPGDPARAGALARTAAGEARRLGMPVREREAAALADRALRAGRDADPLTPREREVADLVAQALTNRQIADQLVLSERTVESHVGSILAKLGLANRTQIATRTG